MKNILKTIAFIALAFALSFTAVKAATIFTVSQGGTGVNTITGIIKGNGTSPFTVATAGTDYIVPASAFTTGSVPFANSSGQLAQDNANFFWDDTNNRLGLGTASPSTILNTVFASTGTAGLMRTEASSSGGVAGLQTVNNNNHIMQMILWGSAFAGSTMGETRASSAFIENTASIGKMIIGNDNAIPIGFVTNSARRMTILGDGNVGIGTASPFTAANQTSVTVNGTSTARLDLYTGGSSRAVLYSGASETGLVSVGTAPLKLQSNSGTGLGITIIQNGNIGAGLNSPTARFHIVAGSATAGTAPLKFNSGTLLATTEAGAIEFDGTHLYFTAANAGTRYQLDQQSGSGTVTSVASADASVTVTNPTTTVDLSVASAPKWTTARSLAGNSVDGSADVAFANKFVVQGTADAGLSGAQFLGALGTGIVKNTTTTGVLSIASAGTDYEVPLTFSTGLTRSTNTVTVNTSQNISTLSNLTSDGLIKTSGGTGALSIASAGTDYVTGSGVSGNCVQWGASNALADAGAPCGSGSGGVTSVSGTANRITSTGGTTPVIDISTTFEALLGKVATGLQQFAPTTSAQLAGVLSDETGTGLAVFNNAPTFIAPVLGTPASGDFSSGTFTWPTFNQNTTGSAAKWTTARNLAGNSVDGSANVAFANKFIVQGTTDAGLSGAQFLGSLGTGIVKNTTTTGVLSIATAGTDYEVPLTFSTGLTRSTNTITVNTSQNISTLSNLTSNGLVQTTGGTGALSVATTTLPSGIVTSSLTTVGTIGTGTWQGSLVAGQYGGTGVANTGKTITLGGNLTTSGAFASTFTMTGVTGVTFPTTGTLATLAGSETFTNKTITSSTNVLGGVTMTLGSDASYDMYYRSSGGLLTRLANGTTGQVLTATTSGAPTWAAPSSGGPTFNFTTIFETSSRFSLTGTVTFASSGANMTSGTGDSVTVPYSNSASNFNEFDGNPSASFMWQAANTLNGANAVWMGIGGPITAASTSVTKHIGCKLVNANNGTSTADLYATVANGTTETATSLITGFTFGDTAECAVKSTGSSVSFSVRKNGGTAVTTTISTNIPTGNSGGGIISIGLTNSSAGGYATSMSYSR